MANTATVTNLDTPAEGVHRIQVVQERIHELRGLCQVKLDAAESYSDAIKAVAEKAGIHHAALAAYVNAVVRGKEKERHEKAKQLDLLFEELGD